MARLPIDLVRLRAERDALLDAVRMSRPQVREGTRAAQLITSALALVARGEMEDKT